MLNWLFSTDWWMNTPLKDKLDDIQLRQIIWTAVITLIAGYFGLDAEVIVSAIEGML